MKILVADDDPTLRDELRELLEDEGHEILLAEDGSAAMRIFEREDIELALIDLKMPKASGLDVLRRLRIVRPEAAAVMITGQGTIDAAVEAMKAGAIDFLEKPYDVEALQRTVRAVMEERRARDLLGASSADTQTIRRLLREAALRGVLLAVLGAPFAPPEGASRVLRVELEPSGTDSYSPAQLYRLTAAIDGYVQDEDRPVVYVAALDILEGVHGHEDVKAWVRHVRDRCAIRGGSLVLASASPRLAAELEQERYADKAAPGLQPMLESLANPIRRAIVGYVYNGGPVTYSAILKQSFVDSSSKLSFHLQKLVADGLLSKVEGGKYGVTDVGRQAWRLIRAVAEEGQNPSLLLSKF